jgi:hypothetical protein
LDLFGTRRHNLRMRSSAVSFVCIVCIVCIVCLMGLGTGAMGCGGAAATSKQDTASASVHDPASTRAPVATAQTSTPAPPSGVAPSTDGATVEPPGELAKLPVEVPLAPEVNAGVIRRSELKAVLAQGIPRFLADVRTEPMLVSGRFSGWRILSLFERKPDMKVAVLRAGDTVQRANGQSIERPEAFKTIWDSLATANELVLDIDRAGRASKLRYTIAD